VLAKLKHWRERAWAEYHLKAVAVAEEEVQHSERMEEALAAMTKPGRHLKVGPWVICLPLVAVVVEAVHLVMDLVVVVELKIRLKNQSHQNHRSH